MSVEELQRPARSRSLTYHDIGLVLTHSRDIRLFKLRYHEDKLHCHLRVANLDNDPVYKAVSYTWGPATRSQVRRSDYPSEDKQTFHEIICGNRSLEVTQNLYDCLLQLSKTFSSDEQSSTDFWVDAICINQTDLTERCQHVNMMSNIYHQAEEVIIWLGPSDDSTPLSYELIQRIGMGWPGERTHLRKRAANNAKSAGLTGTLLDLLEIPVAKDNVVTESPLGALHSRVHWQSVVEFFSRTWFSRSWVVQECVLALKTTVLCGDTAFDWADIEAVSDFLATRVSRKKLQSWVGEGFDIERATYKSPAKLEAVKRDLRKKDPSTLLQSLIRCREYDCKEDKDKIFSLLGIYQIVTQTQLCPTDRLFPDYGLDTAQVFINAAVQILEHDTNLVLLGMAEGDDCRNPQVQLNLPSWVPDWTFSSWKTSVGLGITGYKRYEAATARKREIAFADGNTVLLVKAAKLDSILLVGETKEQVANGGSFDRWLDMVESAEFRLKYRDWESRLDAFWRTLIADTDEGGKSPARASLEAGFSEWILWKLANLTGEVRQRGMQIFAWDEKMRAEVPEEIREKWAAEYELQYAHALLQRPFLTSRGFLGLGSQSMRSEVCEKGDSEYSVWLVCGSRIPLIFRDTGRRGRFHLVGGACLPGFMHGEALREELRFETIGLE